MRIMEIDSRISSRVINLVRIPCVVLVIFIHIMGYRSKVFVNIAEDAPLYYLVNKLFSHIVPDIAVPLFFLISGYLFFYKCEGLSRDFYFSKLKRRSKSLLIPYLLWNTILVCVKLSPLIIPALGQLSVCDWSGQITCVSVLSAFWNYSDTGWPIVVPLWFVRDLLVLCLLSPLIYLLLRRLKIWAILFLFVMWLSGMADGILKQIPFNTVSLLFFSIGSFVSISERDLIKCIYKFRHISIFYLVIIVFELFSSFNAHYLHKVGIIFGIIMLICLTIRYSIAYPKIEGRWVPTASFFIYAVHVPWLVIIGSRLSELILSGTQEWALIVGYFTTGVFIIAFGIIMFLGLKKLFPRFTTLLVGGRL